MNLKEVLKDLDKEELISSYERITGRDYSKESTKQLVDAIIEFYSDYHNIIDLCTTDEMKFLESVLSQKFISNINKGWECKTLLNKFLLVDDGSDLSIPSEIKYSVTEALNNVDWDLLNDMTNKNALAVGFMKSIGLQDEENFIEELKLILQTNKKGVKQFVTNSRLFNYYVKYVKLESGNIFYYRDYRKDMLDIIHNRMQRGSITKCSLDLGNYMAIFYNDFNINNDIVKKFYKLLKKNRGIDNDMLESIKKVVLLDSDRSKIKNNLKKIENSEEILSILDEALDNIPSPTLYGMSKLEFKGFEIPRLPAFPFLEQGKDACLSERDVKLFLKLYLALMQYTNKKYKINPKIDYYKNNFNFSPDDYNDVLEVFWENSNKIIKEFCAFNPYNFSSSELKIVKKFKFGFRDEFTVVELTNEYAALVYKNIVYMVKALSYPMSIYIHDKKLPAIVLTAIIPFKGKIVCDGLVGLASISDFEEQLALNTYQKAEKVYIIEEG